MTKRMILLALGLLLLAVPSGQAQQRQAAGANLGRGVVAVPGDAGGVFVSWRLLVSDSDDVSSNLYREGSAGPVRLNDTPLTATNFVDEEGGEQATYVVCPIEEGDEGAASAPSLTPSAYTVGGNGNPYMNVPLQMPEGYTPNDASVGDLDVDGEYEIMLHQVGRSRDNLQSGFTDEPIIEAYELYATCLWRINLCVDIREGAHYTQFIVYDFDEDWRAEVAMKTADGTTDGEGTVIGDADADYRNDDVLHVSNLDRMRLGMELFHIHRAEDSFSAGDAQRLNGDDSVQSGRTYVYRVKAVDTAGNESAFPGSIELTSFPDPVGDP